MKLEVILGAVKAVGPLLRSVAEWIDPDRLDENKKKRALEYAERFIHTYDEICKIKEITPFDITEKRMVRKLTKKLANYRRLFFKYD